MLDEIKEIAQRVVDNNTFLGMGNGELLAVSSPKVQLEAMDVILETDMLEVAGYLQEMTCWKNRKVGSRVRLLGPIAGGKYLIMDVIG